jgi:NAD(P)-dependent dehydrogenase (short-subunit alcohol dehydrogenase family)
MNSAATSETSPPTISRFGMGLGLVVISCQKCRSEKHVILKVCCAPAHKKSDEDMEYGMQRLFYPLHRLTRAVLPQMLERKRGKIVVVGSADSLRGRSDGVALYGAARAAQHGYMRHVAVEVAPHINVNATAQSYVENPPIFRRPTRKPRHSSSGLRNALPVASRPAGNALRPCCF